MNIPENDKTIRHKMPRIETLPESQIKIIARKGLLVSTIEAGKSAKEALDVVRRQYPDFECSVRSAQKTYKNYCEQGELSLIDKRYANKNQNTVLGEDVKKIILAWWYSRPAAEVKGIWRKICRECKKLNLKEPSYETVQKFLKKQSKADSLTREGKIKFDLRGKNKGEINMNN